MTIRLGIAINETWGFFNEIYKVLESNYQTSLFKYRNWNLPVFHNRINRYLYKTDLQNFLNTNDVVFFEWASDLLVAATRLPKVCGIVTRLHRYELYSWANRVNWDKVDKIIVVSEAKKREFIAKFPSQASKIIVSSPSTSLSKFLPHDRSFHGDIGTLCHISPRKRVYDLILSFYEMAKSRGDLHLHIGGGEDPAYEDYYTAVRYLVDQLGIQDHVTFYGNVKEPWNWYSLIDIFISNSYSEGLQVALMEAMASGCYSLSHHWDGAEEMLPGEQLYFTENELVNKVAAYLDTTDDYKNNQRRLMRTIAAQKFDIQKTIAQIDDAIREVAQKRPSLR